MSNKISDLLVIDKREASIISKWAISYRATDEWKRYFESTDRTELIEMDGLMRTIRNLATEE
jgi:hypothetical protein